MTEIVDLNFSSDSPEMLVCSKYTAMILIEPVGLISTLILRVRKEDYDFQLMVDEFKFDKSPSGVCGPCRAQRCIELVKSFELTHGSIFQ